MNLVSIYVVVIRATHTNRAHACILLTATNHITIHTHARVALLGKTIL